MIRRGEGALALLLLAGCSNSPVGSLSINLVLPEAPDPAAEVHLLRIGASWDGGRIDQEVAFADGGVRLGLPTDTAIDLRIEGIGASGGAALWRGVAHGATVPETGNAAVSPFFGKVGGFSYFGSVAEMPPLEGTAATPWGPGQVILTGGSGRDGGASFGIWIYDHQRVRVSSVASLITPRSRARALTLTDPGGLAFLMVAGGLDPGGFPMTAVELFRPPSTHLRLPPLSAPQSLPGSAPLDPAGQQILIGCGAGAGSPVSQVQVYAPALAFVDGGSALVASLQLGDDCRGGQVTAGQQPTEAFVSGEAHGWIDRVDGSRSPVQVARVGATPPARTAFAAVSSSRGLVLIAGLKNGVPSDEVDRVDGGIGHLREPRADFGWLVVPDAGVLIVGGRAPAGSSPLAMTGCEWLNLNTLSSVPAGRLRVGRIGSAVAEIPGYEAALVVSGQDDLGVPVGGIEIYTYP